VAVIQDIKNQVILKGRQNNQCWFAPNLAVVPPRRAGGNPEVHVTANQLTGNDCGPQHFVRTDSMGAWWTPPMESQNLVGIPREDDFFEKVGVSLFYHQHSRRLLGFGSTHFWRDAGQGSRYKLETVDWNRECTRKNTMLCTEWDFERCDFAPWQPIETPPELDRFHRCHWPRLMHELPDGTVLGTTYVKDTAETPYSAVLAIHVEILPTGKIRLLNVGNLLRKDTCRGLAEPSIVHFGDRYFMTIRHDETAYVAAGDDGLHYDEPVEWRFDDGEILGNYNTQQHWLAQDDSLFLLYNRRHELNNGVFRSRAPLFIAEVDPEKLCVLRETERIVFPENGARMGNFNVANVTDSEAWVVTGEWLEGMVEGITPEDRFYVDGAAPHYNRVQFLGDLLLGRILFA
jgi:hypothetical protein